MTIPAEQPRTALDGGRTLVAPAPPEVGGDGRDDVRLLVAEPAGIAHARFRDLPRHLSPGDLVVVNTSATVPRAWDARALDGTAVVLHAATTLDDGTWVVEVRSAPSAQRAVLTAEPGDVFAADEVTVRLLAGYPHSGSSPTTMGNRLWRAAVTGDLRGHLRRAGRPIAYGYLDRGYPLADYQTVFSRAPGSAEMPSAGRPFTAELVVELSTRGVGVAPVTLHTGVSSQEAGEGPQAERFAVPGTTARRVTETRRAGGRIVAVGTTVTRALESAVADDGTVVGRRGWTDRVVTPSRPPRVVDGLVTGWHDPGASHLLLVEAVAGADLTQRAYDAALGSGYRWHEFGDSSLLLPGR